MTVFGLAGSVARSLVSYRHSANRQFNGLVASLTDGLLESDINNDRITRLVGCKLPKAAGQREIVLKKLGHETDQDGASHEKLAAGFYGKFVPV